MCFEKKRCAANPLKKCTYCIAGEEVWKEASALSVLLTYQKLQDDKRDSGFGSRMRSYFLLPVAAIWQKKAKKQYPEISAWAECFIQAQQEAETAPFSFDRSAEPTAQLLAKLFSSKFQGSEGKILYEMGYYMGRWVYLMDAADDIEKDLKQGNFNPFVKQLGFTMDEYEKEKREIHVKCNETLNFSLSRAVSAMQLLSFRSMGPIVENVVAKGLAQMQREILFMDRKKVKANVRSL